VKNLKDRLTVGLIWLVALVLVLCAGVPRLRAREKSFLWKVGSERNSLYILGSIHFLRKNDYPLKKVMEDAFTQAKKLVLEVDLSSANRRKIQRLTLEKGVLQNDATLQQNVSPETYKLVEKRAGELGLNMRGMSSLKPWVVAVTLAAMKLRKLGFDPDVGVDRYFAGRAEREEKPVQGLETPEFQIGLFDQLSRHDQELMLLQTLKEMDLLERSVDRIINAWKTGDVAAMEKLMLASMREYPEVRQKLIDDRNRRWVPQLERFLSGSERALVVVGAAHLVGPTGIIELLKRKGYRVEQL
jgi:uncharacterized protein YbaP (TraB family)